MSAEKRERRRKTEDAGTVDTGTVDEEEKMPAVLSIDEMSVKELKKLIAEAGLSSVGLVEKSELRERALQARGTLELARVIRKKKKKATSKASPGPRQQQQTTPSNIDDVALYNAVRAGDYEQVCRFITAGADVNHTPTFFPPGYNFLLCACQQGHYDCARLLIENGADVNKAMTDTGVTPLFVVSQNGHVDTVRLLIEKGADVNKAATNSASRTSRQAGE